MNPCPSAGRGDRRARRARAMAYLFVLTTTLFVVVVGISGLSLARIQAQAHRGAGDAIAAAFYAQSAIDIGLITISNEPAWRTSPGAGVWIDNELIGVSGRMTLTAAFVDDGDGNVNDDDLLLTGIGVQNQAVHRTRVTVRQEATKLVVVAQGWEHVVNAAPAETSP